MKKMYKVNANLREDLLKAIGNRPFNEIRRMMTMLESEFINADNLKLILDAVALYPYLWVRDIMNNINKYVEEVENEE